MDHTAALQALESARTHARHAVSTATRVQHPQLADRMRWTRRVLASAVTNAPQARNSACAPAGMR